MASLKETINQRKRIWLTVINGLLALLISWVLVPESWLQGIIKFATLPVLAVALIGFLFVLVNQIRRLPKPALKKRFSKGIIIFLVAAAGFQFVHEEFGYKILMDEYNLTATSFNMHVNKTAFTPTRGLETRGDFEFVDGYIDKRPYLFPFLVSIVHDLTGYRVSNPFILNALLTCGLFLVVYLTGFHLGNKRGGILAVLILAGLPLIAQNATGAGFELLNFLLIALSLYLSLSLAARPGLDKESLLVLSVILLAHVRYESILFLFPVALLLACRWKSNQRIGPGWITTFSPWLLIPLVLQNRWFNSREDLWELPGDVTVPFSLDYVPENIGHAMVYFFNWSPEYPNSMLVTVLGGLSLFFLLVVSLKRYKNWMRFKPRDFDVLGLWGVALLGHMFVVLAYHVGKLDSHFATRLGLPVHLILVLAPVWVLVKEKLGTRIWNTLIVGSALYLVTISAPHSSQGIYTKKNFTEREFRWVKGILDEDVDEQYLVLDSYMSYWVSYKKQAMHIRQAIASREQLLQDFSSGRFPEVFVVQRIVVDPVNERSTVRPGNEMPGFELETIDEYVSKPFQGVRLSRLTR